MANVLTTAASYNKVYQHFVELFWLNVTQVRLLGFSESVSQKGASPIAG